MSQDEEHIGAIDRGGIQRRLRRVGAEIAMLGILFLVAALVAVGPTVYLALRHAG